MRVIAFLVPAAIAVAQGTLAHIEGRVLNSAGEPVREATLQLMRNGSLERGVMPAMGRVAPVVVTDTEGQFEFRDVVSGHYSLSVDKPGFVPLRAGTGVEVEVPSAMPVTIRLAPQSVITGRITEEHGDPLEGAQVEAIGEFFTNGRKEWRTLGSARTDDRGVYRLSGLKSGRYRIGAWRSRENGGTSVAFHPNADNIARGALILVREGESLSSIDIQAAAINRKYRIRGIASANDGSGVQQGQTLTLRNRDGLNITSPRAGVNPDGTFEFSNVTPGRYFVETLFAWATAGATSTMWSNVGRAAVTVTNGDVDNVRILIDAGYEISGRVTGPDTLDRLPRITLVDVEGPLAGGDASIQAAPNGSFQLKHVMSGHFVVDVTDLPKGTYVESIRYGDRDITHSTLELTGATSDPLNIALAANAASISGSLGGPGNAIALWPVKPDLGQVLGGLRVTSSGEDGRFIFDRLPPGDYRVVAWTGIEKGVAQYAPFIARFADKAVILSLKEAAREEIDVPIVPRAEAEAVLEDLL